MYFWTKTLLRPSADSENRWQRPNNLKTWYLLKESPDGHTASCLYEILPITLLTQSAVHVRAASPSSGNFINTESRAPPQIPWIRICIITRSPGDLCTDLRSVYLEYMTSLVPEVVMVYVMKKTEAVETWLIQRSAEKALELSQDRVT